MPDHHPFDQVPADESRARDEWEALLGRMQAADRTDARLSRVRQAIASGEFQVDARAIAERLIARFLTS